MPNRIIKEQICTSDTMALLSAEEERCFTRVIVQCDDYGRFDGRASIIRARCFPLQLDNISDGDVERWLERLVDVGLIMPYTVDGRRYVQVVTWVKHQGEARAKTSKYPDPSTADGDSLSNVSGCEHLQADEDTCSRMSPYPDAYPVSGIREADSDIRESLSEETALERADPPPRAAAKAKTPKWSDLNAEQREVADAFNAPLVGVKGYEESRDFLAQVVTKYGELDLAEIAMALRGHALTHNKPNKTWLSSASIVGWLRRDLEHLHGMPQNGRTNGKVHPPPEQPDANAPPIVDVTEWGDNDPSWVKALLKLDERLSHGNVETLFDPIKAQLHGSTLVLAVPRDTYEQVVSRFGDFVKRALEDTGNGKLRVQFVIAAPQLAGVT